jgi:hypothetical protein
MAAKPASSFRILILALILGSNVAVAQSELRETFFKDADAAKAAADAADAELLSPRNYERGMSELRRLPRASSGWRTMFR